jgi:hypothetical protein
VKIFLLAIFLFTSLGKAQGNVTSLGKPEANGGSAEQPSAGQAPSSEKAVPDKPVPEKPVKVVFRRLESVSWNPVSAELTWMLSVWDPAISTEQPAGQERYVIHLDKAVMEFKQESRGFDSEEAKRVRSLMDLISRYALESTVWWGRGGGTPGDHGNSSPNERDRSNPKDAPDGDDQSKPSLKGTPIALRPR